MKLVTGGSGIAMGLPANFREAGKLRLARPQRSPRRAEGQGGDPGRFVLAAATRGQIAVAIAAGARALQIERARHRRRRDFCRRGRRLDRRQRRRDRADRLLERRTGRDRRRSGEARTRQGAGALVEGMLASIAGRLQQRGYTRLLVAGGETSGAVVDALGVCALEIGPEIDPGVPWTLSLGDAPTRPRPEVG